MTSERIEFRVTSYAQGAYVELERRADGSTLLRLDGRCVALSMSELTALRFLFSTVNLTVKLDAETVP